MNLNLMNFKSWEGVVDMIGIQEFIKPTKVQDKMISKKTLDKKFQMFISI